MEVEASQVFRALISEQFDRSLLVQWLGCPESDWNYAGASANGSHVQAIDGCRSLARSEETDLPYNF